MTNDVIPEEKHALRAEGGTLVAAAQSVVVTDMASHAMALSLMVPIETLKRRIEDKFKSWRDPLNEALRRLRDDELELTQPLAAARNALEEKCSVYEQQERKRAEEEAARIAAEAAKREEERRLAEIAFAQSDGDQETEDALLSEPMELSTVITEPQLARVNGISKPRKVYRGECVVIEELIAWVAMHMQYAHVLQVNQRALNALATAQGDAFRMPGCRLVIDAAKRSIRTR